MVTKGTLSALIRNNYFWTILKSLIIQREENEVMRKVSINSTKLKRMGLKFY
jgi:hypothetical protein